MCSHKVVALFGVSLRRLRLLLEYQISDSDGKGQPHGTNMTSFVPH